MAKKIKEISTKKEVSREQLDNDHVVITYDDGSKETRLV